MKKATVLLLSEMMPMTKMMLKEMKFSDMMIITGDDGLIYVVHRAQNYSHNPDKLVLLSPKHPYTKLIATSKPRAKCQIWLGGPYCQFPPSAVRRRRPPGPI